MRGDRPLCALDIAAKVVIFKIDVDIAGEATVFTFDLGRAVADGDVRQQTQRHVRAVRGSDTAGHQRFQRITISARVTQVDGKALASIDEDRKSVVEGKGETVRVNFGGRRII